jgi:SH3-like domain-containing protein
VVPPHGPVHPQKPKAKPGAKPTQAVPSKPPQPVPATPPAGAAAEPNAGPVEKLPDAEKPEGVPSKLPRFASLRSDDVNMRAGPGTRYRIDWIYKRRDLPVEIEREFDVWRWVRDPDGIQGWVHQATLMGRRSFIVQKADAILRSDTSDTASAVAILKPGVIGRIRSCAAPSDWCDVQTGSYRGYLRREAFWGLLPGEAINP